MLPISNTVTNTKQELVSVELKSITSANPKLKDGDDGKHNNHTLINNQPSKLSGNWNGSIFIKKNIYNYIYHYNMYDPPTTCGTPVHSSYPPLRPPAFGNNTNGAHLKDHKFLGSTLKHTGGEKLACSDWKRELIVPSKTTTYQCYECAGVSKSISGYKQSREDSVGVQLFNQNQLQIASTNGSDHSSSLFSTTTIGNKRAVLCKVTYSGKRYTLKGTVDVVVNMKNLLVNKFKFPIQSIRVLTEEQKDPNLIPTKRNIMESLKWLVKDCKLGDSLVFCFSGYGMQQPAIDKDDEIDGFDETICPVDFIREGMITDDEINSTIVRPLNEGVKLHAIIDACHSGTTLDLMYAYKKHNGNWKWMNYNPPSIDPVTKCTNGGLAICFSACEDCQMAADTAAFGGKDRNGVMTYLIANIIREHSGITYAGLLEKLPEEIGMFHQSKHFNGILKRIFPRRIEFERDPLLSSSEKFDINTRISF